VFKDLSKDFFIFAASIIILDHNSQMENKNDEILVLLRDKIKRIINLLEKEKEKRKILEKNNIDLEQKFNTIKEEKEDLTTQYNNLKLAKDITGSIGSNHNAKLKVNRIVREIDKCIALLNK
jgi:hypothetical protein